MHYLYKKIQLKSNNLISASNFCLCFTLMVSPNLVSTTSHSHLRMPPNSKTLSHTPTTGDSDPTTLGLCLHPPTTEDTINTSTSWDPKPPSGIFSFSPNPLLYTSCHSLWLLSSQNFSNFELPRLSQTSTG